jgi:hypothetical protein
MPNSVLAKPAGLRLARADHPLAPGRGEHWPIASAGVRLAGVNKTSPIVLTGTTAGTGPWGRQIDFHGVVAYGRAAYHPAFDLSDGRPFTIFAWVYFDAVTDGAIVSQFKSTPSTYSGLMLWTSSGNVTVHCNGAARASAPYSVGQWYHLAVAWDGSSASLFLNARLSGSGACPQPNGSGADLIVGGYYNTGSDSGGTPSFRIDGKVANLRITRRVPSMAEIQADVADAWAALRRRSLLPFVVSSSPAPASCWMIGEDGHSNGFLEA